MPRARRHSRLVAHDHYLYALGADCLDNEPAQVGFVDRLNVLNDNWEQVASMAIDVIQ